MKIKLIEAGGFVGRHKIAFKHVTNISSELAEEVKRLKPIELNLENKVRDLERHYLQIDDEEPIPIEIDNIEGELKSHIDELKKKLEYL